MIRLFWDTNILLDLLGKRTPFYESAAKIATLADEGKSDFQIFFKDIGIRTYTQKLLRKHVVLARL